MMYVYIFLKFLFLNSIFSLLEIYPKESLKKVDDNLCTKISIIVFIIGNIITRKSLITGDDV